MTKTVRIIGGLLCAALGAAAIWAGLELTEPVPATAPECVRLEMVYDDHESILTWETEALVCPGETTDIPLRDGRLRVSMEEK